MKLPDILSAFHTMPTCDRLDLICRLLRSCVPYELRFLGTIVLDAAHAQMKSFASLEISANQVNHYSGFKASGVTHLVCEKLCCALAVVHAHNNPVAEALFSLLDSPKALQLVEETDDLKVVEDMRLLYVMAVNHPALSFSQRQRLLYGYLQRMDSVYSEKKRLQLVRNLTSSTEKSGEGEGGVATLRREPGRDACMTYCEVHSVYKRLPDKRYIYMIQVEWTDGTSCCVRRTYGDFFSFHTKLLDQFPEEGGQRHKKERMIPFLPGKSYPRLLTNRNSRDLAEKRLPELHRYTKELLSLPAKISQCDHVLDFFRPRPEDLREEYPPVDKLTTLYDLLESGKARLRNYTDPLVTKATGHSPQLRSSPLHRASAENTPTQSRTSHTLPHQSTSATSQAKEEASGLERRFTYPSRRSAFTPVTPPQQHETPPTSTHLTNSHPSIANGGSPSAAMETSVATETVSEMSNTLENVISSTSTSSLPTSSHGTSITPSHLSHQPPITTAASTSAISVISSSHHHTPSPGTTSQPSNVAKPMPTYAPSHTYHPSPTISSPTKLPHLTHSHLHRPTVSASPPPLQSGKTMADMSYSIPLAVGPPIPLFNPIIIGYPSPAHSPSPSPLTPGGLRGKSSSNISRTPTEFDSFSRWLKSLRLHKYAPIFENMTFDELLSVDKNTLKRKGMTEGAANKLLGKIEELKVQNFTGFRDMSYNPLMTRKPSTCSLPAALLTENRVTTPCSSVEGLSPTDSTCSLDKATLIISQTGARQADMYFPLNGSAGQEHPARHSVGVSKALSGTLSGRDGTLKGPLGSPVTSPSSPLSHPHQTHTLSPPSDVESDVSKSTLTRSSVGVAGGVSTSWADRLEDAGEEEREARTPEWAQLHGNRCRSRTPSHSHKHTPVSKRHSAEPPDGWGLNDPATSSRPLHQSHGVTRGVPAAAGAGGGAGGGGNWLPRPPAPLLPSSSQPPGGRHHRGPPQSMGPLAVNGLLPSFSPSMGLPLQRPAYLPSPAGVLPGYHAVFANHSRATHQAPQPAPACFNCGKKGHYGTSCPADTIDTNNPDMFHRQLERLAASQYSSPSNSHRHT